MQPLIRSPASGTNPVTLCVQGQHQSDQGQQARLGAANPVALHALDAVVPVEVVQVIQQPLRKARDAQHPLPHWHAHDRVRTALRLAVCARIASVILPRRRIS